MLKGNLCRCTGYHAIEDAIRGIGPWRRTRPVAPAAPASPTPLRPRRSSPARPATQWISRWRECSTSRWCARPTPHAKVIAIRKERRSRSRAFTRCSPGRTSRGASTPRRLHDDYHVDPDDTYILDNVVRFVGQRVVAVVAETEGAAEEGCRRLEVDYEVLPAVFDPEKAMLPPACPTAQGVLFTQPTINYPRGGVARHRKVLFEPSKEG